MILVLGKVFHRFSDNYLRIFVLPSLNKLLMIYLPTIFAHFLDMLMMQIKIDIILKFNVTVIPVKLGPQ